MLPHVQTGRLTALAVGTAKRHEVLPQVPPLSETGIGEINTEMWYGVFAPKDTSPELITRLNRELPEILTLPEVAAAFTKQGMTPASSAPQAFRSMVAGDAKMWAELIKSQNIRAE